MGTVIAEQCLAAAGSHGDAVRGPGRLGITPLDRVPEARPRAVSQIFRLLVPPLIALVLGAPSLASGGQPQAAGSPLSAAIAASPSPALLSQATPGALAPTAGNPDTSASEALVQ